MTIRFAAGMLMIVAGTLTATAQEEPKKEGTPRVIPAVPIKPVAGPTSKPAIEPGKELKVGHVAPALTVDAWVKGEAVAKFERGTVYIVEFWATWCGPCLRSIPHLTELQKKHGSRLVIIGMASSERRPGEGAPDERLDRLRKFVELQGEKMDYRIAYDSKRAMSKAWMEPAGQNGIPCAFIVGADGKITWIGNPLDKLFDTEVDKALSAAHDKDTGKPEPKKGDPVGSTENPAPSRPTP